MSLRTVVEVALHFESFRNVDLFHQGLYHLKTRLYRDDGEQRSLAIPYGHSTCPVSVEQPKPKPTRIDHHHLIPAHTLDEHCTFSTRSFLIRYCEEEVELNDIGQFRIELGIEESEWNAPLTLEVDLMFADLTQHGGADRFGEQPDVDSTEFKSVSTQTFRVHGAAHGLHEFVPVVFDEFHFCLANLVVHSVLLDFRFRLRPLAPVPTRPKPARGSKAVQGNDVQVPTPGSVPVSQNAALSLAETIYGGHRGQGHEQLLLLTEGFYQTYFGVLAGSYAKLLACFEDICKRCLTNAQRDAFADVVEVVDEPLFRAIPVQPRMPDGASLAPDGKSRTLLNGHGTSLRSYLAGKLQAGASEQTFASHVAYDMNVASCQILRVWHKLLNVVSYSFREKATLLRASWERRIVEQWSSSIIKEPLGHDITSREDPNIWEVHNNVAEKVRKTSLSRTFGPVCIEDLSMIPELELHPILFEQRYSPKPSAGLTNGKAPEAEDSIPSAPKRYRGVHLFVLVHGWQGNSFDMRLMKNNLALLFPDAIFLSSTCNEDNTEGDMNESGIRLAQEVVNYICDWCPGSALGRLSFITFSAGGLIVRAALPLLHEYSSKMFTALFFSTPHLGSFPEQISLINSVLWGLKKWRKSKFLEQLSMTDGGDPKEGFIYRLSKTKGLEWFQYVVLVSSYQDQYVPYESARVEMCRAKDSGPGKDHYPAMVKNLLDPVKPDRVFRFDVNFAIPERNLDAAIGRAAHIRFLECQPIMKMIMHNYSFLFR
mmetsp:Transcript_152085/g.265118  ORF Transcript_152085/g.265118 Transcript_152085/m.265118 type:complete len:767 (-) Transcript_152085:174-2474(-)